jgi:hypothetical protein
MTHHTASHTSAEMQQCIDECTRCHHIRVQMVDHCLELGGKHANPAHIRLLLDCAEMCQTCIDFMLRGSGFQGRTCGLCAELCRACADDCERIADGDQMMLECVDECRRCAESCERMAA